MTYRVPLQSIVGLPLLYSSAYFLPPVSTFGGYLLPSHDLFRLIILPTAAAVSAGAIVIYLISMAVFRWFAPKAATATAVVALSVLALIGLKGVFLAAGYDWEEHVPRGSDLLSTLRYIKYLVFLLLLAFVFMARGLMKSVSRLLSSLGFALGLLAAVRLFYLWQPPIAASLQLDAMLPLASHSSPSIPGASEVTRRVVWVIFDETDFDRVYGGGYQDKPDLKNFKLLAGSAVFAARANSPASATLYSIPALLTGMPVSGDGVRFDKFGNLRLESPESIETPFSQATSIFGALASRGLTASVLGFYHPYCKLFTMLRRCDSATWPSVGGIDAALWANIPDALAARLRRLDIWEQITYSTLRVLPQYLARDDALTFVHLNFPHLPSTYADSALGLAPSANPLVEYSHNLILSDRVLGDIMKELKEQASRHDTLLVVSTDHWLRNRSYRANIAEASRPIPLLMWKVQEADSIVLTKPVSTFHTAGLILDFLDGKLTTQSDIAQWWDNRSVYPSFIAPNT